MNLKDLSAFITNILRSDAEVVTAFIMGVLLTGTLVFFARRWLLPLRFSDGELARKDAEIARRDAELARKDIQLTSIEAKLTKLFDGQGSSNNPGNDTPPDRATVLEVENAQLVKTIEKLQAELKQVSDELNHAAKWLRFREEENVRLSEALTHGRERPETPNRV